MAISKEEVKKIAMLARLEIEESELDPMAEYFNDILAHFNKLRALDLEDINPFLMEDSEAAPLREDRLENWGKRDLALREAPNAVDDFFRVPRIMGEDN